jgi:hypothetical protein
MAPTPQQKYFGERSKAVKLCYDMLDLSKKYPGKLIVQDKHAGMRSPKRKLYECVEAHAPKNF